LNVITFVGATVVASHRSVCPFSLTRSFVRLWQRGLGGVEGEEAHFWTVQE